MPSFMSKVSTFARSPQGRKVFSEAQRVAKDPNTKRKIAEARSKLQSRDRPPR